jgi:hypothetical protein
MACVATSNTFPIRIRVPGYRAVERSKALKRNKVLPAVVYGTEASQVEVLPVYGIAGYRFIVPAAKCGNPQH